jgi:hypothetical protein
MPANLSSRPAIDDVIFDGPQEAASVRLRIPSDKAAGIAALGKTWPCQDGTITAETTEAMLLWYADNTSGVRTVRVEWLDGTGNYLPGDHNRSINGCNVIDAQAEPVKPLPTMQNAAGESEMATAATRDLLTMQAQLLRDAINANNRALDSVTKSLDANSRAVVQIGSDNSTRAQEIITMLIGETLAAKDDARASAVQREQDQRPGEQEGDAVKLARELKDVFKGQAEGGLRAMLKRLVDGDKATAEIVKKQLAPYSDEDKAKIIEALMK